MSPDMTVLLLSLVKSGVAVDLTPPCIKVALLSLALSLPIIKVFVVTITGNGNQC